MKTADVHNLCEKQIQKQGKKKKLQKNLASVHM